MTSNVRIRLMIFALIAAVGITYVAASYLGVVDRLLGRRASVSVLMPRSGGLYEGSSVDYRGIQVGTVKKIQVTRGGVRVRLDLDKSYDIPKSSPIQVHNLSAVGEQYLEFDPTSGDGPYLADGDVLHVGADALPETTDQLLTNLNNFTRSVDPHDLSTVVGELGTMFRGNAVNLRRLVDSGSELIRQAKAHEKATISLLDDGRTVLATQAADSGDIRSFAHGLAQVTQTLKTSDPDLRTILDQGPSTVKQADYLVRDLKPVLPGLLGNLTAVTEVFAARLPAIEQTLVTFPRVVASGFTGTPGDGYGHLNMQLNYNTPPCTQGYKPPGEWLPGTDLHAPPAYHAKCTDPRAQRGYTGSNPINQRGVNLAPPVAGIGREDR